MPDPTLPTIYSVGQRRVSGGGYPSRSGPGTLVDQIEQPNDDPPLTEPGGYVDPCTVPARALEWNADASAADARRQFEARAAARGDDGLYSREWFTFIYESASGSTYLGPITSGDQATVTPDATGMTPDNVVGFIHNHPGGSLAPSGADWTYFNALYSWIEQFSAGGTTRANLLRHYIISRDVTASSSPMAIRVYNNASDRNSSAVGPDVNPESVPCS